MNKNLSRMLVVLLLGAFLFPTLGNAADLTAQEKYDALAAKGIFSGINGEAALDQNMNRAQFARVAALILGLEGIGETDSKVVTEKPFSDVELGLWYTEEIAAAKEAGIFVGNPDGTFNPKGDISVQELAVATTRLLGLEEVADQEVEGAAPWAAGYIQALINAQVDFPTNYTAPANRRDLADLAFQADAVITEKKEEEKKKLEEEKKAEEEEKKELEEEKKNEQSTPTPTSTPSLSTTALNLINAASASGSWTNVNVTTFVNAGITGVTTDNISTVKVALQSGGSSPRTVSGIQDIVNTVISIKLPESIESTSQLIVGQAYTGSVAASGGTGDVTYTVTSGQLPPGLNLDPNTGEITGTPSSSGTYSFTISTVDSATRPATASAQYMMTIALPAPTMTHLTSNPATVTLTAVGATQALAITASFNNDTSSDVTAEAQYASNDENVATVSAAGVVTAVTNGTTNIVVTYGGLTKNVPVTVTIAPPAPALTQLTSNSANVTLTALDATLALAITASFDNDTSRNVTGEAQYASNDASIATVSAEGIVTAVANGTTNIVVTYGGLTKNVPVMVTVDRQLESIYASLSSYSLAVGAYTNITVYAYFDDDSSEVVTEWAMFEFEVPDLATIDANGYLTALTKGATKITVTFLSEESIIDFLNIWDPEEI